ncbi:hypothetical protein F5Y17DRAFT_445880 [Xylariaceae sp. FL0594]|nr:hypothetical protein F5Y17DRAFT_445880 [Xylariaceae sp. FL0594]
MTVSGSLTTPQLGALLDILVHHETYAEVQSFRKSDSIENYGWPFVGRDAKRDVSSSPLLQLFLTRIVLGAPAVRDLPLDFWPGKFRGMMKLLGDAGLSDSYDKGTLGTRKRLATAASVIHESLTRGILAGLSHDSLPGLPDLRRPYNREEAGELSRGWHDCVCQLVYGNLLDEIFDQLTRTESLEEHSPGVEAAIEYAELHLASFIHQIFILSAEGPDLLKLIENVHRLIPYSVIGQTLRVGNAASMINAMSRLVLSKVSVGAISNWIGLTTNAADGMNLMQRIISSVLEWDNTDFRRAVDKIKQQKGLISGDHLKAIERHLEAGQEQHDKMRQTSIQEQKSIIVSIFDVHDQKLVENLTDEQHTLCLEYYAARLAIRDRQQITDVLCNSSPDLTTSIVSDCVAALDPMIRAVHKSIDLRKHLGAAESFISDFIKTTKPNPQSSGASPTLPSVKDIVLLLRRHRHLLWVYLHEFCSACPELRDTWRKWMKGALEVFRQEHQNDTGEEAKNPEAGLEEQYSVGAMKPRLEEIFAELSNTQKEAVIQEVDAHSRYLVALRKSSRAKIQQVLDELHGKSHSDAKPVSGPGAYAARWQALLDNTLITPAVPRGPPRLGKDVKGFKAVRKRENEADITKLSHASAALGNADSSNLTPPDVSAVIEALGPQFKKVVAEIARDGLPTAL